MLIKVLRAFQCKIFNFKVPLKMSVDVRLLKTTISCFLDWFLHLPFYKSPVEDVIKTAQTETAPRDIYILFFLQNDFLVAQ